MSTLRDIAGKMKGLMDRGDISKPYGINMGGIVNTPLRAINPILGMARGAGQAAAMKSPIPQSFQQRMSSIFQGAGKGYQETQGLPPVQGLQAAAGAKKLSVPRFEMPETTIRIDKPQTQPAQATQWQGGGSPSMLNRQQQPTAPVSIPDPLEGVISNAQGTASRWSSTVSNYFPPEELSNAINVMFQESSGNPSAININSNGSKDYGLYQINDIHAPRIKKTFGYSMEDLLDPVKNLEVASWLFKEQGWTPWVGARMLGIVE